jgi:hypothetical protein
MVSMPNRDSEQVNAGGDPNWNALAGYTQPANGT